MFQQGLFVLKFLCHFRQVFCPLLNVYFIMCKETGGYIYQLVSGEFPVAATCSEEE